MKRIAVVILVATSLALGACNQNVDLESIQTFTQAALDQEPAFTDLAADFYGSCQRGYLWRTIGSMSPIPAASGLTIKQQSALVAALAAQEMAQAAVAAAVRAQNAAAQKRAADALAKANQQVTATKNAASTDAKNRLDQPTPSPSPSPTSPPSAQPTPVPPLLTVKDTGDPCQLQADAAAQWENANLVLLNYARALGGLAGANESVDNSYGFDTLAQELNGSGTLSSSQAAAFKDGAALLTRDIFAAKRRDAIAANVTAADAVVNNWINILESVANDNYRQMLTQERKDIDHFFTDNFESTQQGLQAFQVLQYKSTWIDERAAVDQRVGAINAYVAALEAFRSAHGALVARIQSNNFSDFYSIAHTYVSEIGPQISKISKAFAPSHTVLTRPAVPAQPVTAPPGG